MMSIHYGHSSDAIQLIIHADDWGQHPAVNRAIHSMIRQKTITSASLLAGGPTAAEACRFAARNKNFCTGAHLSLSCAHSPLARVQAIPSLTDGHGSFLNSLTQLEKVGNPCEILLEMDAQIRLLLNSGIRLTHLDTHQGCMLGIHSGDERLFPVIRQLCLDYRLPFKLPRQTLHTPALPQAVRTRLGGLLEWLEEQRLPLIDDLIVPEYRLLPGEDYNQYKNGILHALSALKPGTTTELTLHPALPDEQMKEADGHWIKREWEFQIALDEDFRKLLKERSIVLTSWSKLTR